MCYILHRHNSVEVHNNRYSPPQYWVYMYLSRNVLPQHQTGAPHVLTPPFSLPYAATLLEYAPPRYFVTSPDQGMPLGFLKGWVIAAKGCGEDG
jgi:hypothetical protein